MSILTMCNKHPSFYKYMGWAFNGGVLIDGAKVNDEDRRSWYLEIDDSDKVIGFAAVIDGVICACFVVEGRRRAGIMTSIIKEIIRTQNSRLTVFCNGQSLNLFKALGFLCIGEENGFSAMELSPGQVKEISDKIALDAARKIREYCQSRKNCYECIFDIHDRICQLNAPESWLLRGGGEKNCEECPAIIEEGGEE